MSRLLLIAIWSYCVSGSSVVSRTCFGLPASGAQIDGPIVNRAVVQAKNGDDFVSKCCAQRDSELGAMQSNIKNLYEEGRFKEILEFGIDPVNAKSFSWETQYYLGMANFNRELFEEALPYFQQLLDDAESDKAKGKWNLLLGNSYQRMGNQNFAKRYYLATLDYLSSPWALIWLSVYEIELGNKHLAYGYLRKFVESCDVPNLLILLRVDELKMMYSDKEFDEILGLSKEKIVSYFKNYDVNTASVILRGNRMECLTTFSVLIEKGLVSGHTIFSERMWEILADMGYSKLDIYLESARLHLLNGNVKASDRYLELALNQYSYPFLSSELLKHCEWLSSTPEVKSDPRRGFEEKVEKWVKEQE